MWLIFGLVTAATQVPGRAVHTPLITAVASASIAWPQRANLTEHSLQEVGQSSG
jgi:hypothetical protein